MASALRSGGGGAADASTSADELASDMVYAWVGAEGGEERETQLTRILPSSFEIREVVACRGSSSFNPVEDLRRAQRGRQTIASTLQRRSAHLIPTRCRIEPNSFHPSCKAQKYTTTVRPTKATTSAPDSRPSPSHSPSKT